MEIAQSIRSRLPLSFILAIKINSVEFQDKGFDPEECKQLCASLEANKFDFVELSGGTYESLAFAHKRESTKKREAFFLDFAETIVPALTKTRTYITGGFKTVGAMVNALKTVDGVGLARPVCQEPRLCADILSGKVKGAIKQRLDENNFGITNVAAGSQIRMIGRDQEPIDLSLEEHEEAFKKDMGDWTSKMAHDTGMYSFGYVDIESIRAHPPRPPVLHLFYWCIGIHFFSMHKLTSQPQPTRKDKQSTAFITAVEPISEVDRAELHGHADTSLMLRDPGEASQHEKSKEIYVNGERL
ncbi:MAG: hypothetical protein Q9204_008098 [Flavoplaca sp. TL-2023a]